jgi:hypothetical protein
MNRLLLVIIATTIAFLLSGCNRANPETTPEKFVELDCGSAAGKTFEDWDSWAKVNPTPILSEGHSNSYVDIYVDDLARTTYFAATAPYPECARIVKAKLRAETAPEVVSLTVMVKMPAGYDPENNDWWYGKYDVTGTKTILSAGKRSDCIACHLQAAVTDYLFSEEVLAASND